MAEKKKILYIVEAMGGGVFTYIVELANALADTYDMYIAYAVREQTPKDYKSYFDKRVHLIHVKNFRRAVSPAADVRAFFEIRRIAAQIRPDVIHLHSSKAGALGRFAFNGNKVPLFYTPHGYSFLMQNTSAVKRSLYRGIEVLCGLRPCTTISCSVGENTEAKRIARRAVCVDNGIDIPELQAMLAKEPAPQPHPFTVFTLGRICYQKNPAQFNRIAQAMPDVRFLWIGDGEDRPLLTAPNIEITGWAAREEALRYASAGDVFVLTSLWEGLPIALLEAMYMKKTCAVSDVIGNRDVIHNGENGFVCTGVDDYVQAIRRAQRDECDAMKELAYADILNHYNTQVMAEQYSRIYDEEMRCKA